MDLKHGGWRHDHWGQASCRPLLTSLDMDRASPSNEDLAQTLGDSIEVESTDVLGRVNTISMLSQELFIRILTHNMPTAAFDEDNHDNQPIDLRLGGCFPNNWSAPLHVCRAWRSTIMNCPSLWTNLFLTSRGGRIKFDRFNKMLELSQNFVPLAISANFSCPDGKKHPKAEARHVNGAMLTYMYASHKLNLVPAHLPRLTQLAVHACRSHLELLMGMFDDQALPRMRKLHLICCSQFTFSIPEHLVFPNLQDLAISCGAGLWTQLCAQSVALTHLFLVENPRRPLMPQVLHTLGGLKLLQHPTLKLSAQAACMDDIDCNAPTHDGHVILPKLETITIEEDFPTCYELLRCITVPTGYKIDVKCTDDWEEVIPTDEQLQRIGFYMINWLKNLDDRRGVILNAAIAHVVLELGETARIEAHASTDTVLNRQAAFRFYYTSRIPGWTHTARALLDGVPDLGAESASLIISPEFAEAQAPLVGLTLSRVTPNSDCPEQLAQLAIMDEMLVLVRAFKPVGGPMTAGCVHFGIRDNQPTPDPKRLTALMDTIIHAMLTETPPVAYSTLTVAICREVEFPMETCRNIALVLGASARILELCGYGTWPFSKLIGTVDNRGVWSYFPTLRRLKVWEPDMERPLPISDALTVESEIMRAITMRAAGGHHMITMITPEHGGCGRFFTGEDYMAGELHELDHREGKRLFSELLP